MISNFKLSPYFNISQNFVQNVQKQKKPLSLVVTVQWQKLCMALYHYTSFRVMDNGPEKNIRAVVVTRHRI